MAFVLMLLGKSGDAVSKSRFMSVKYCGLVSKLGATK